MYLSMYCFWTGEKEIGKMDGIVSTEAGFMHGKEVVKVEYDKTKTKAEKIAKKANKLSCGDQVFSDVKVKTDIPHKSVGSISKGQTRQILPFEFAIQGHTDDRTSKNTC